jgi:hypothetical protein
MATDNENLILRSLQAIMGALINNKKNNLSDEMIGDLDYLCEEIEQVVNPVKIDGTCPPEILNPAMENYISDVGGPSEEEHEERNRQSDWKTRALDLLP